MTERQSQLIKNESPLTVDDAATREHYRERLREYLKDPAFRAIEGFPIGNDEAILAMSDPPYYTACPNPFFQDVLDQWIESSGQFNEKNLEAIDGAGVEPYVADVSEGKGELIYNAHTYHTKVPHKAIMRYLLHYTKPGDIVLDPFSGTGMTGVAAALCDDEDEVRSLGLNVNASGEISAGNNFFSKIGKRHAVLLDLSPAASFLTYNYTHPITSASFHDQILGLLQEIEVELGWMYQTWHPSCDDPQKVTARVESVIWSDVYICSHCLAELVFWEVAVDHEAGSIRDEFVCSSCGARQSKRNSTRVQVTEVDFESGKIYQRAKQIPVRINYRLGKKILWKKPDAQDQELIDRIESTSIPYWYPTARIDRDLDLWYERDYRSLGIYSVDQFFTKRNLHILAALWDRSKSLADERIRAAAMFCITGMQVNLSKMNRWRPNVSFPYNPLSGTLYVGALQVEANVLTGISNKANRLVKTFDNYSSFRDSPAFVSTQSATGSVLNLQEESIDYIFTDPPFGSNIIYSDLSIIWESWLGLSTDTRSEAVIHRRKKESPMTLTSYRQMMAGAFRQLFRLLRPGRWMTVEFHNSQNSVWAAIQSAIAGAGFVVGDVRTLDKQMGTFKQVNVGGAVKQDLVISAYRPSLQAENNFKSEDRSQDGAWVFVREHLQRMPISVSKDGILELIVERQAFLLFDRMVAFHIQRGRVVPLSAAEFYEGLRHRFIERDGMFFLPEQVPEYDSSRSNATQIGQIQLFVSDEKSSLQWLRQQLDLGQRGGPKTYQEIQPLFLRQLHQARHEQLPELMTLLQDNFLQDASGRWYVPDPGKAGDLERLRKNALLREFQTYLTGRGKLKQFRTEAVRAGFADAYAKADFQTIVKLADRLPETVLQEDPDLLMYYDNASLRV